jgi:hypothetical protein
MFLAISFYDRINQFCLFHFLSHGIVNITSFSDFIGWYPIGQKLQMLKILVLQERVRCKLTSENRVSYCVICSASRNVLIRLTNMTALS